MTGCSSSKVSRANLVPFTKDLRQKLERENIDLKQVQFYIDQKLVLDRNLGDQKVAVTSGVVPEGLPTFDDGVRSARIVDAVVRAATVGRTTTVHETLETVR